MSPDKEFETVLNTKEDEEVPTEYDTKQEDKREFINMISHDTLILKSLLNIIIDCFSTILQY